MAKHPTHPLPICGASSLWHYNSNPSVIFGLMNEPHIQTATEWLSSANAAIAAIPSAGAAQQILVPGRVTTTAAGLWNHLRQCCSIGTGVQDPLHNYAFEVHQYLDFDGSGTHRGVVSPTIGIERVTAVTQWAEATGNHLFLGEVGVKHGSKQVLTALDGMLRRHPAAYQRLGRSDLLGGWPVVGERICSRLSQRAVSTSRKWPFC